MRSRAIYSDDTTSYVKVDEIYDDTTGAFDADNVNALLKYITGDANITYETAMGTLNEMTSTSNDNGATTSADIRAKAVTVNGVTKSSSQDVIVRFGGLDWQVVYLSKTTEEAREDIILTLWLSSSKQDTWADRPADEGRYYGFIDGSLYSDWSADWWDYNEYSSYISNMYGTSYIRAVTLNNGGEYSKSRYSKTSFTQNSNSVFARFTMEEVENSLTQYITTPSKVSWQLDQSAVREAIDSYLRPNESINFPSFGSYYDIGFDYHDEHNYAIWQNDYIWLPSVTETGYNSWNNKGLWEASNKQRANFSSSTSDNGIVGSYNKYGSYSYTWTRSAANSNATYVHFLHTSNDDSFMPNAADSYAVRPALHLNLNKVIEETEPNVFKIALNDNGGSGGDGEIFASSDGYYADEGMATKIESVAVPSFTAHKFLGYFTEGGQQVTDANGVITMTSSQFAEATTLFAHWEARNPAYYDSDGGYWYVENGKLPQSKVSESLKATLSGQWSSLSDGSVYYMGVEELVADDLTDDGGMQSKVYNGEEYVKFNGEYYLVEPIRWRLVYSSSQQEGYAVENTSVLATMAEIVFVGSYSSAKIGVGAGYSAESVTMLLKNQVSTEFLVNESREVEIFGAPKDTTSVSGSVFVASSEELASFTTSKNNTTGSGVKAGKVSLSDFVKDYLRATGQGNYYFTRDLGDQLNTIRCLNPVGNRSQAKAQQTLGVQFTIKVTEYACKEM